MEAQHSSISHSVTPSFNDRYGTLHGKTSVAASTDNPAIAAIRSMMAAIARNFRFFVVVGRQ
jgi:hypothetical protein